MRKNISTDETYSLQNNENYKRILISSEFDVAQKYAELTIEYFNFIIENTKIMNLKNANFIIISGLDTITNVFLNILFFTKNINVTYFHCQKAFYFYLEFIGQISEDDKIFLQLTSTDATMYVYKKTIFEINNEVKKHVYLEESIEFNKTNMIIQNYIHIVQTYIIKVIQTNNIEKIKFQYIAILIEKLKKVSIVSVIQLNNIIEKAYYIFEELPRFIKFTDILLQLCSKNSDILTKIEDKLSIENFILIEETNMQSTADFMKWVSS